MEEQASLLYQAATFYRDHLSNRRFLITVERKKVTRTIEILFLPCHFYHLLGLHKLTDLPRLRRAADSVYHAILSQKITDVDLQKSMHFDKIADRLCNYKELLQLLHVESVFFRSLHGKFKGITADCVLTKQITDAPIFGFLFMVKQSDVYFPCSFFTRNEMREYTKDGTRWNMVSVEEIARRRQ